LCAGRLTTVKGVDVLLDAMARLDARGVETTLTIAGDGPARADLEAQAAPFGDRVSFAGWLGEDDTAQAMRDADLLVMPSVWPEPFGLVGIEAAALGLPAVAFDVGGIPDWLTAGVTGELAPGDPPSAPGLAAAIERALAHRERLRLAAWEGRVRFSTSAHLEILERELRRARERTLGAQVEGGVASAG
jgi:glycosyltransferase involved in cell wall biosynthesis